VDAAEFETFNGYIRKVLSWLWSIGTDSGKDGMAE
jgi:hypothetical protein